MRCRFGSNRRLVATMEWLRLLPKLGLRPQTEQTLDMLEFPWTRLAPAGLRARRLDVVPSTVRGWAKQSRPQLPGGALPYPGVAMPDTSPTTPAKLAGSVTLSDDAVAQVVGRTVLECYGVVGMASKSLVRGVARTLGRESLTQGVEVRREGDGLRIALYVILEYGLNLAEVAATMRQRVAYEVGRLTRLEVGDVEIHIQGVRRP
jgi:uncharacterized alkaline shock family protein YloU